MFDLSLEPKKKNKKKSRGVESEFASVIHSSSPLEATLSATSITTLLHIKSIKLVQHKVAFIVE